MILPLSALQVARIITMSHQHLTPPDVLRGISLSEREGKPGGGEVAQTMYTNVSKCKNDKTKNRERR
jgi:hypothetical protein